MIYKTCILPVGRDGQRVFSVAGCHALQLPRAVAIGLGPMVFWFYRGVYPLPVGVKKGGLLALLLFSVCRNQFIDVTAFVRLLLEPFDVLEVNSHAYHLLGWCAPLCVALAGLMVWGLFCFHVSLVLCIVVCKALQPLQGLYSAVWSLGCYDQVLTRWSGRSLLPWPFP